MTTQYDSIGEAYAPANDLLYRPYIERPTLFNILGPVEGLRVLDVACGDGKYSRLLTQRGAKVVATDVSEEMIRAAQKIERQMNLGIDYRVHDAAEMPELGRFDVVTAMYLLHYAPSKEHMARMCSRIHANMKPGGRFITFVANPDFDPKGPNATKYGLTMRIPEGLKEGDAIFADLHVEPPLTIQCYHWSRATHEQALRDAGFRSITWPRLSCSPEGEAKYGKEFWQDYLTNPHAVFLCAEA